MVKNIVTLLECMDGFPVSETVTSPPPSIVANMGDLKKTPAPLKSTALRRAYQECWVAALRSVIDPEELKTILREKTHLMIKHFMTPELLMDFFTGCYDRGGPLALLALDGLFQLIEKRNLDYPDFYKKLYAMFDRNLLHLKYRAQFFRLVDVFLGSSHLPATITASFIKRMSRLSLSAPPAAIVTIVPFVYNLLRKHPTCLFMLHRANQYDLNELRKYGMEDPFLPDEEDPISTEALESCLWELVMLRDHYNPNVARFCGILAEQFTKPTFNTEEFLEHSYASARLPVSISYENSLTSY
jgi:U3 small nucleolar RNA-associated protein 19